MDSNGDQIEEEIQIQENEMNRMLDNDIKSKK